MNEYLLDTNLIFGVLTGKDWARKAFHKFQLDDVDSLIQTSIICEGEILTIAIRNKWQEEKLMKLRELLEQIPIINVDNREIAEAYSRIQSWSERKSKESPISSPPPKSSRTMGQNDLWIAATAYVYDATLLSSDKDFQHLKETWIKFEYISQS